MGRGPQETKVVQRSYNNSNANESVAYLNTNNSDSNTSSNISSRLANRNAVRTIQAIMPNGPSLTKLSEILKEVKNHVRAIMRLVGQFSKKVDGETEGDMRREGYIIEEIIEYSNMLESFNYVMRGTKRKTSAIGIYLMENKELVIQQLQKEISEATFKISSYREYKLYEWGKERIIQVIPLRERIALNAIMRVVEKHLVKRFIADSAAGLKGRGLHYLFYRMVHDIKNNPQETKYIYKCDIRKFYMKINQVIMMDVIRKYFKDKKLIILLDRCVSMLPKGLSIGLRTSQALGNLLLNYYVDHKLKDQYGVKYYRRYCDDELFQAATPQQLTPIIDILKQCVSKADLDIKPNDQLYCINNRDINFLGYRVYGNGKIAIRKRIKKKFAKKIKTIKSKKRKRILISSFYGLAKHAHSGNLFKRITGVSIKWFQKHGPNDMYRYKKVK